MATQTAPQRKLYRDSLEGVAAGSFPGWFDATRDAAWARFRASGFPDRKRDEWRFVNLEPVLDRSYEAPCDECLARIDEKILELYFLGHDARHRLVFVNGFFSRKYSSVDGLPEGASLSDLATAARERRELVERDLAPDAAGETNPFVSVNTFRFADGAFFHLPAGASLAEPVHFLFVNVGAGERPVVFYPRILVSLGARARASVVVNHVELAAGSHFMDSVADVRLGEGAHLSYLNCQRGGAEGAHVLTDRFRLAREAGLEATYFLQGGSLTRGEAHVRFEGEHAGASLQGLSLLKGNAQSFFHAVASHGVPHCSSRQFFKNVLAERARSEFTSLVDVAKGAVKSESQQLNKNLVLSEGAQALSRPQLRILNDDVSCQHGATVGRLEKDELFYLRSRGLSKEIAEWLLVYGFAEEIVDDIEDEALRRQLEGLVRKELDSVLGGSDARG